MGNNPEVIIKQAISDISSTGNEMPGVVIVHNLIDWSIAWMSARGLELLGISLEEITNMSHEEYFSTYFNKEDTDDWVPKVIGFLEKNNSEEICTYFHQVRFSKDGEWNWYMGSVKIFARDERGKPLLIITIVLPIDSMHHMAAKAERLVAEKKFLRKHYVRFEKLSKREREVLRLLALGKSSPEAAAELFLSVNTVETHRKNIRRKLEVSSYYELCEYARAFDLI